VIVAVPRVAVLVASKETVTVHVGVQGLIVKVAVTPVGSPEAEKVTADPVPLVRVAVMEDEELLLPCVTVRLPGVGVERLKSKTGAWTLTGRNAWLGWRLIIALPTTSLAVPVAPDRSTTRKVTSNVPAKV